jgi:predicted NAD/FAD-binding protein
MKKVAVIGSGISGMAAAYFLSRKYEVSVFEKEHRIGGHTHTHRIETSRGVRAIDSGFIVHNERTYPNLVRLLRELKVETENSDMSFGVTDVCNKLEYSSRGLRGFFAAPVNLMRRSHYGLLQEILRFNRQSARFLRDLEHSPGRKEIEMPLAEFVRSEGYSSRFMESYLYPLVSAVWSTSMEDTEDFPAVTLIRFFENHGMLGIHTHPQWKVIRGGSNTYVPALTAPFRNRIRLGVKALSVVRDERNVTLRFDGSAPVQFDQVVFACPGRDVLATIQAPTTEEQTILGGFRTTSNEAVLHTDSAMLPARPWARASWNYRVGPHSQQRATLTYHMNRLQNLGTREDYCVYLNDQGLVKSRHVIQRINYMHPLYTAGAIRAQKGWDRISGRNRTHFCGAYWFYGFHEDGLNSALRVAKSLGVDW